MTEMMDVSARESMKVRSEEQGSPKGHQRVFDDERAQTLIERVERRGDATVEEIGEASSEVEEDIGLLEEIFNFLEEHDSAIYEDEDDVLLEEELLQAERKSVERSRLVQSISADDTIGLYLYEMAQEPLLTHDEEIKLARQIERGEEAAGLLAAEEIADEEQQVLQGHVQAADDARARFIRANTQLVVSIAKRYRGQGVPFLDLIQEGNLGLMKAVEKFDYRRGNRFSTYATWWIRQSVSRALPSQGRTIRVPIKMSNRIRRIYKTSHLLEQALGREPTASEIAETMDLDSSDVRFALRASRRPLSLEKPVGEEEESELGDFVADELLTTPTDVVEQSQLSDQVEEVLETLTPREAQILRLRFGLQGGRSHTLKEVGKILGLTRERVRQIEKQAVRRLQYPSRARLLRDFL